MPLKFTRINYDDLNAKQKELFNFQKLSAVLADYGYSTVKLSSDWQGADFIAQHLDGTYLKIQLKGRFWLDKKYLNKDIHIAFHTENVWFIYPHDEIFKIAAPALGFEKSAHWKAKGNHHRYKLTEQIRMWLTPYMIEEKLPPAFLQPAEDEEAEDEQ